MRVVLTLAGVLIVFSSAAGFWYRSKFDWITTSVQLTEAMSPDGAWHGSVVETLAEGPIAGLTFLDAHVVLMSTSPPAVPIDVLGIDTMNRPDNRPSIAWLGPDRLQVSIPAHGDAVLCRRRVGRVSIVVRLLASEGPEPATADQPGYRLDPAGC